MPGTDSVQSQLLAIEDVIGLWQIAPARGESSDCVLALSRLAQGGGYGVHVEACSIPALAQARRWLPTRYGFELQTHTGQTTARFRRLDVDSFQEVDGAHRLERAPQA